MWRRERRRRQCVVAVSPCEIPSLPRMPDPHIDIMLTRGTACMLPQAAAQQQLESVTEQLASAKKRAEEAGAKVNSFHHS